MMILTALVMALFMRLGFWQLQRAVQKEDMLTAEQYLSHEDATGWQAGKPLPKQYQRLKITGRYLSPVFLLDNQHYEHRFGYNVLSPFVLDNGEVIIIDRGWVVGDSRRQNFPKVSFPKQTMTVVGSAYFPSEKQWVLGPVVDSKTKDIVVLEILSEKIFNQVLQKKVYPFIIRLDKREPYGFVRQWKVVSMPPQRHKAYALQWFAMAFVVFILFVVLNVKSSHDKAAF